MLQSIDNWNGMLWGVHIEPLLIVLLVMVAVWAVLDRLWEWWKRRPRPFTKQELRNLYASIERRDKKWNGGRKEWN